MRHVSNDTVGTTVDWLLAWQTGVQTLVLQCPPCRRRPAPPRSIAYANRRGMNCSLRCTPSENVHSSYTSCRNSVDRSRQLVMRQNISRRSIGNLDVWSVNSGGSRKKYLGRGLASHHLGGNIG